MRSRIHELRLLASGLCHDAAIRVEETDSQWAWSPADRTILVARDDLHRRGIEVCAGIIAHEVGHALISRYSLFDRRLSTSLPVDQLLNAVEDPRVELYMAGRYPGTRAWTAEACRQMGLASAGGADPLSMPLIMQFMLVAAGNHHDLWAVPNDSRVATPVREALAATVDARRTYAVGYHPNGRLEPGDNDDYAAFVLPELLDTRNVAATEREVDVQRQAYLAYHAFVSQIVPALEPLWAMDVAVVSRVLQEHPYLVDAYHDGDASRRRDLAVGAVRKAIADAAETSGLDPASVRSDDLDATAAEMLRAYLQRQAPARATPLVDGAVREGSPRPGTAPEAQRPRPRSASTGGASSYREAATVAAPLIDALVDELDQILSPRAKLGQRTGYRSGTRADLRAVMTAEARGDGLDRLWVRRTVPDRRRAAFLLLVDLSGSMRGAKVTAALEGTVLFAETCHRLKIPCAVRGFQDEVIPFLSFRDRLNDTARAILGEMPLEVVAKRRGGHNRPQANDDGPCVRHVAKELMAHPADDRVLLVVSDGQPAGTRSGPRDLRAAVKEIRTRMPSIALVGIGIGEEAGCVKDFYPDRVVVESVGALPSRLAVVLRRLVARGSALSHAGVRASGR